jgi:hypothetical protein
MQHMESTWSVYVCVCVSQGVGWGGGGEVTSGHATITVAFPSEEGTSLSSVMVYVTPTTHQSKQSGDERKLLEL